MTYAYYLVLNDMRGNSEGQVKFGPFASAAEAGAFASAELVEPYEDSGTNHFSGSPTTWRKCFRKDGPLEWCNPESFKPWGHGIWKVPSEIAQYLGDWRSPTP